MDLSLLRSNSILNKYSLNAIPRDGDGGDSGGDSGGWGDSWGSGDAGVAFGDAGFGAGGFGTGDFGGSFSGFDSGGSGFDAGGGSFGGNSVGGGGGWADSISGGGFNGGWGDTGGVGYGQAGVGFGGFGTGDFFGGGGAYNGFDGFGGNYGSGMGWDSGFGSPGWGYGNGFGAFGGPGGGLGYGPYGGFDQSANYGWGPGDFGSWGGFGGSYGNGFNGMGPYSGFDGFSLPGGAQYNQGLMGDYTLGGPAHFGDVFGSYNNYGMGPFGQAYGPYGANPAYDVAPSIGPMGNPNAGTQVGLGTPDALTAINNALSQNQGNPNPSAYGLLLGQMQENNQVLNPELPFAGKDQSQFTPNNNPFGYPNNTWDAASYFGGGNVTNQAQNSRDSFNSKFGEWGTPNANPNISNFVVNSVDNFNSRYGDLPAAPALSPGIYGDLYDVGPTNVTGPASTFGGPYAQGPMSAADAFDLGEQGRAGSFPAALSPTQGDMQVAYDFLNGGPNAGPQLGLGGPLSGLVNTYDNPFNPNAATFDSRFGGPYTSPLQWTSDTYLGREGRGDLYQPGDTFAARFGDNPLAINGTPTPTAYQSQEYMTGPELGGTNLGPGYPIAPGAPQYALQTQDMRTQSPGLLGGNLGNDLGINFGQNQGNPGKADAFNTRAANTFESRFGALPGLINANPYPYDPGNFAPARGGIFDVPDIAIPGRETTPLPTANPLSPGERSGRGPEAPSRGGEVTTRGGRTDLSPDNSREAAQTARSVTQAISRGDPNSMAYLNSLLQEARTAPTLAGRIAALDALNGVISAMKGAGLPNPYGRDPDSFIASQLRQGR